MSIRTRRCRFRSHPGQGWRIVTSETKVTMKRIGFVLSIVLSLCAGAVNVQAHGCGFWPFWGFGLGLGLGAAWSYPAWGYTYSYPAWTYAPPVYAYDPPAANVPAAAPVQPPQPPVWKPSTSGAGHWVPDPTPYRYTPATSSRAAMASPAAASPPAVTVAKSAGGVPVYTLSP